MGGPWKFITAAAAVLACATCLAACGGSGDDSTQSASAGSEGTSATSTSATAGSTDTGSTGSSQDSSDGESTGDGSSGTGTGSGSGSGEQSSNGASRNGPVRGKVSAQSAEFQQYSRKGKLHLAEFGDEASSNDFGEAQEVVVNYLQAARAEEWDKACTYLSPAVVAQVEEIAAAAKEPTGKGCGAALGQFAKSPLWKEANGESPIYAPEGISSLRMQQGGRAGEGAGFALFHGSDGEDHWLAMKNEGGWKVLSTSPQPFL